jgi:hypothetical protein
VPLCTLHRVAATRRLASSSPPSGGPAPPHIHHRVVPDACRPLPSSRGQRLTNAPPLGAVLFLLTSAPRMVRAQPPSSCFDTRAAGDATHFLFVSVSRPRLCRPPQRRDTCDFGLLLTRRRDIALATSDSRSGPPPCLRSALHPSLGRSRLTRHCDAMAPRRPLLLAARARSRRLPLAACHILTARQPASARRSL